MGLDGVLGIIVPISDEGAMHDVFHGKAVHASLAPGASTNIEKGDRILFYDSGKSHNIVGEAVISDVAFEEAAKARHDHGAKLCVDGPDLDRFISSLPAGGASVLRVLRFEEAVMYAQPVKCDQKIAEEGTYMTAQVFASIARANA